MANIKVSGQQGGILRQEVTTGSAFTGIRTANAAGIDQPSVVKSSILQFDRLAGDGEGLFEFAPFVANVRGHVPVVFVSWVKVLVGPGVAWSIAVTDGDEGGAGTFIDTVALDVPLASGAGNAAVRIMRDFAPGSRLRFIGAAAHVTMPFGAVAVEIHPIEELARPWG